MFDYLRRLLYITYDDDDSVKNCDTTNLTNSGAHLQAAPDNWQNEPSSPPPPPPAVFYIGVSAQAGGQEPGGGQGQGHQAGRHDVVPIG